jgi:hypothetical protein
VFIIGLFSLMIVFIIFDEEQLQIMKLFI